MSCTGGTDFKDFKAELLKNKAIRREHEALQSKYEIIEARITRKYLSVDHSWWQRG